MSSLGLEQRLQNESENSLGVQVHELLAKQLLVGFVYGGKQNY
jgi:hypothetical protein